MKHNTSDEAMEEQKDFNNQKEQEIREEELSGQNQSAEENTAEQETAETGDEYYNKWVRLYSEFENFRKRTNREKMELVLHANGDLMASLVPVLDDFERALKSMKGFANDEFWQGVELIYSKLRKTLEQKGLKEMESLGQPFDPEKHDALTKIKAPDKSLKGKVVDEIEKGYLLNDKIIRHAKVVVGE